MRGSLPFKVRIAGCQPIRRLSGTYDSRMLVKLVRMVHTLHEQGRDDLVNGIAAGTLKPLQVYNRFRFSRLEDLPHAEELPLFRETWPKWLDTLQCGEDHHRTTLSYFKRFEGMLPADATIGHVVDALKMFRESNKAHPRTVNLAKSNVQAFLRDTLGVRHKCYQDAVDVKPLREMVRRAKHPLNPDQLRELCQKLGGHYGLMAWTMATTGMGWKEYTGPWEREGAGLRIHGTKTGGRDRLIPAVSTLHRPQGTIHAFRCHLRLAGSATPYDFRRTFANLMVEAGVPRPRRMLYLGHSAETVTDLYEWMEVREFLEKDAERMRRVLGDEPEGPTIQLVRGA